LVQYFFNFLHNIIFLKELFQSTNLTNKLFKTYNYKIY
jgi:hypothetical protein